MMWQISLIDVASFPYILVFLGTMQLGQYDFKKTNQEVADFVDAVHQMSPRSLIIFSGLLPRPLDWPQARTRVQNYSRAYSLVVDDLKNKGYNVEYVNPYPAFINQDGTVARPNQNYIQGLYLSTNGIRQVCAIWLRFLGFFPPKAK